MKRWEFVMGEQVETPTRPGKPEWSDALSIEIPDRRHAWQLVLDLLGQLKDEDGFGVTATVHGMLVRVDTIERMKHARRVEAQKRELQEAADRARIVTREATWEREVKSAFRDGWERNYDPRSDFEADWDASRTKTRVAQRLREVLFSVVLTDGAPQEKDPNRTGRTIVTPINGVLEQRELYDEKGKRRPPLPEHLGWCCHCKKAVYPGEETWGTVHDGVFLVTPTHDGYLYCKECVGGLKEKKQ